MVRLKSKSTIHATWTTDASGAVQCAQKKLITVIVDVIDMSTSLEASLQSGAMLTLGASPSNVQCPVQLNPDKVAKHAVDKARHNNSKIILITEPRVGSVTEREENSIHVMAAIKRAGGVVNEIIPNVGSEISKLADFTNKVVIAVTATGGTAFDAAFNILADDRVTTATIARIRGRTSEEVIKTGLSRATSLAEKYNTGIGFVAASKNSLEDVLAAKYLASIIAHTN